MPAACRAYTYINKSAPYPYGSDAIYINIDAHVCFVFLQTKTHSQTGALDSIFSTFGARARTHGGRRQGGSRCRGQDGRGRTRPHQLQNSAFVAESWCRARWLRGGPAGGGWADTRASAPRRCSCSYSATCTSRTALPSSRTSSRHCWFPARRAAPLSRRWLRRAGSCPLCTPARQ